MFSNNINKLSFTYDNYLPSLFEGLHAELATFREFPKEKLISEKWPVVHE